MLLRLVTDFPEPDSPTKASISPWCKDKFTECSTRFLCAPSPKESDRFLICKMGFVMALYLNFEGKDYIGKGKIQLLEFVYPHLVIYIKNHLFPKNG
tara:strand:- start:1209 stop:1499 length:291 start_codon:yes stop_codon:yes gene_type:complete